MMEEISISVIVPVYNVEKYLEECIQSIQKQNFEKLEIICVEDCSTDNSLAVLQECAAKDERITILQNEENMGLSCARNRGMETAKGKYLMFVDSDDMLAENALQELYQYAESQNVNGVLFDVNALIEGEVARERYENTEVFAEDDMEERIYHQEELLKIFSDKHNWKMEAWRYFWKREALMESGICFYPGLIHEDNLFSFYAWMEIDQVAYLKKKYYIYRKRDNSIVFSMNYRRVESLFLIFNEIVQYWKKHHFDEMVDEAIRIYLDTIYRQFQQKKRYFNNYEQLSLGHPADGFLFEKFWNQREATFKYAVLNDEKVQRLKTASKVIVYGAGNVGGEAIELLEQLQIHITAIAVTSLKNNSTTIKGYVIRNICDLAGWKDEAIVLIAAVKRHHESIKAELDKYGFENVITFDCEEREIK